MKRQSGVLLNVSSLPGRFGIGGFSLEAENFIGEIAALGFRVWQTLPITTIGAGNSPYSGISSYAGNYLYIDPDRIDGELLTHDEIHDSVYKGDIYLTDYDFVKQSKWHLLQLAYNRITSEIQQKIDDFREKNKHWLNDYAVFMCLRQKFEQKCWIDWDNKYKYYCSKLVDEYIAHNFSQVNYYFFEQYLFYNQWERIKQCAKDYNVQIFGDLPIYVSFDSVDVWSNTDLFQLDKKTLKPKKVAGVPPDYFAKEGQLWDNPLYDYKVMKKDNYKWWTNRLVHMLQLYDIVRIDHFRGLYKYWAVDAGAPNAINGEWEDGPGLKLFDALKKVAHNANIVAEDLGLIDKEVEQFLKESGFMGMRVIQFGFDGDVNNKHLPHNYYPNCVAYTGTHDNDTSLGWLLSLTADVRDSVLNYVSCDNGQGWASGAGSCRATKALIRAILSSTAKLAIIPMQDLCGYGSDTRMNVPGQAEGCWRYRTNYSAINSIDREFIMNMNKTYGRC
ncbi:MAG: 4-alpha-glucanotransferase [Clostridiales bacterium]|nr:4-alpha-glucanotransferase [Clostridiales bacterium]